MSTEGLIAVPIMAMMCNNIFEVYLKALTWNSAGVWSLAFAKTECTCVRSVKNVCGVQISQNIWSVQKVCILWFVIVKKVSTDNLLNVGKGSCIKMATYLVIRFCTCVAACS